MDSITYLIHFAVYSWIGLVLLGGPLVVVLSLIEQAGPSPWRLVLYPIAALLGLAFLLSGWFAHSAARRRVLEDEGFLEAIGSTYDEVVLALRFLPFFAGRSRSRATKSEPGTELRDPRFDDPHRRGGPPGRGPGTSGNRNWSSKE